MSFPYDDDDTGDMPEFMQPDMQEIRNLRKAYAEYQVAERREMVRWGAIACRCRRWFDWYADGPPQADCPVHGVLAIDPFTGEVI